MVTKKQTKLAPKKRTKIVAEQVYETDSTYFLKLVVFVLLGTLWLKFSQPVSWMGIHTGAIPVGLLVGLVLVSHFEKYQPDRKIWYAILLVVTIICYFVPAGILI
jgi:multisubunit Na+/H+ antiporter MnhE subunit